MAKDIKRIKESKCPHCKFLSELFSNDEIESNREYWIMTEVFVYLHDGKDYCNYMHKDMNVFRQIETMEILRYG